jgi:hypothetical protein
MRQEAFRWQGEEGQKRIKVYRLISLIYALFLDFSPALGRESKYPVSI